MKTEKEKQLTIELLTEKLERISGKKVSLLKEEVIHQNDFVKLVESQPRNTEVTIEYSTIPHLNKTGINQAGEKIINPYLNMDLKKHNIVTCKINFDIDPELLKGKGSWGEKKSSSVVEHNGQYYIQIQSLNSAKPTYTVNSSLISKEELLPFMTQPKAISTIESPEGENKTLSNLRRFKLDSIDAITIGGKEYQITK